MHKFRIIQPLKMQFKTNMQKKQKVNAQFEHGQLIESITLKAIFVTENESFLIDDQCTGFQMNESEGLEPNKTFEIKNVVIEKRNNFAFSFSLVHTKETKITKSKRNSKKQYSKTFEKFDQATPGKTTHLKCIIVEEEDLNLKLFDGSFFRMKLKKPLTFESNRVEMLFVKKSYTYKYAWETGLTQFFEGDEKDQFWKNLEVPQVELYDNVEEIPIDRIGKWSAMLTTVIPPYTYSNFISKHKCFSCCSQLSKESEET